MTMVIYFSLDFQCMEPLGMESGEIHSDQITVSSQYSAIWSSERSRLNYPENGWTPGEDSIREWIQVKRQQFKDIINNTLWSLLNVENEKERKRKKKKNPNHSTILLHNLRISGSE